MKHFLGIVLLLSSFYSSFSQSLIVGIPSADVAEKHHLEFTHESQIGLQSRPYKWNSFNFLCYGLGNNAELTVTLNNLNNDGSTNAAIGFGAKKVFPIFKSNNKWEHKLTAGSNILYGKQSGNIGFWSYGHYSFRVPATKTRLTAGVNYGQSQTFGFKSVMQNNQVTLTGRKLGSFIGGIEQPLYKNISLIADWYSGTHDLAAFIPALQIDVKHHVFIVGYKIPNNAASGNRALIVEFMLNLPTRKR